MFNGASRSVLFLLVVGLCLVTPAANATVVIASPFQKLVSQADQIVKGTVSDVSADWENTPGGRMIFTYVTVKAENILKGRQNNTVKLRFLGGIMYGAYRIVHDPSTNQDIVTRNNGKPLRSTTEIPNPPSSSTTNGQTAADQHPPMTVNDFEKAIRGEMQTRAKSLH